MNVLNNLQLARPLLTGKKYTHTKSILMLSLRTFSEKILFPEGNSASIGWLSSWWTLTKCKVQQCIHCRAETMHCTLFLCLWRYPRNTVRWWMLISIQCEQNCHTSVISFGRSYWWASAIQHSSQCFGSKCNWLLQLQRCFIPPIYV